jgi:hypothetical protein
LNEENGGHAKAGAQAAPDANGTQGAIQVLLDSLCCGHALVDESLPTSANSALDLLCNCAALLKALKRLRLQSQDKTLDIIFQARISAMVGVLNLFLDLQWLKKLSQCLATLERLACHKSHKIDNNLKIIYVILHHLGFRIHPRSCNLDKN